MRRCTCSTGRFLRSPSEYGMMSKQLLRRNKPPSRFENRLGIFSVLVGAIVFIILLGPARSLSVDWYILRKIAKGFAVLACLLVVTGISLVRKERQSQWLAVMWLGWASLAIILYLSILVAKPHAWPWPAAAGLGFLLLVLWTCWAVQYYRLKNEQSHESEED